MEVWSELASRCPANYPKRLYSESEHWSVFYGDHGPCLVTVFPTIFHQRTFHWRLQGLNLESSNCKAWALPWPFPSFLLSSVTCNTPTYHDNNIIHFPSTITSLWYGDGTRKSVKTCRWKMIVETEQEHGKISQGFYFQSQNNFGLQEFKRVEICQTLSFSVSQDPWQDIFTQDPKTWVLNEIQSMLIKVILQNRGEKNPRIKSAILQRKTPSKSG